eukprot:3384572-Pleurochrysis_carterae.AAC.3
MARCRAASRMRGGSLAAGCTPVCVALGVLSVSARLSDKSAATTAEPCWELPAHRWTSSLRWSSCYSTSGSRAEMRPASLVDGTCAVDRRCLERSEGARGVVE